MIYPTLNVVLLLSFLIVAAAFKGLPSNRILSKTHLFEDFNLDFSNPTIISSPEIFQEVQLREYTAEYSVDERINVVEFFLNLFKKDDEDESSPLASKLKKSVSLSVLEEKTAQYVKGSIDAKTFYGVLSAAFGNKLSSVLPEIVSSLPAAKASALSKLAK
mmetsp:Transcript_9570/g.15772  ORF Transcript_9570/g.15772 Transcript_9570/m.15772 type:complete len:161 (+) Transcript_9570:36-518(+)